MTEDSTSIRTEQTIRVTIDLPDDVLRKLELIARDQSTWDASKARIEVKDVISKVLNLYLRERISSAGVVLPDIWADGLLEPASPIVRATNAVLVQAIDNGISNFQIPPSNDSANDAQLARLFPEHIRPWFIRRLKLMTTPEKGIFRLTHDGDQYTVYVEFDETADEKHCVRVKIAKFDSA